LKKIKKSDVSQLHNNWSYIYICFYQNTNEYSIGTEQDSHG
jgi:hypothetical protein